MKKLLLLSSFCLLVLLQTLPSYAQAAAPKEYVTIYLNHKFKSVSVSDSNGNYKEVSYEKYKGPGDQTQLLKLVKEHEAKGYKLSQYEFDAMSTTFSVIMEKD